MLHVLLPVQIQNLLVSLDYCFYHIFSFVFLLYETSIINQCFQSKKQSVHRQRHVKSSQIILNFQGLCTTCCCYASNVARQCGCHAGDKAPGEAHQPQQERKLPDEAPPHRWESPLDPGGVQRHRGRGGAAVRLRRPQQGVGLSSPLAQILTPIPQESVMLLLFLCREKLKKT